MSVWPERITGPINRLVESNFWRRIIGALFLVVALTVVWIFPEFSALNGLMFSVLLVLAYVEIVASRLGDMDATLSELTELEILDVDDSDTRFAELIREERPEEVVMVDYSSDRGRRVLEAALNEGATVYLFIKAPVPVEEHGDEHDWSGRRSQPVNTRQYGKIVNQLTRTYGEGDNLYIYLYRTDASVRARLIDGDDSYVSVGWYRFGTKDVTGEPGRGAGIHGANNPMILLPDRHPDHWTFSRWLREYVLPDLLEDSITLHQLLDPESEFDCPQTLRDVYEQDSEGRKMAFARAVSAEPGTPPFEHPPESRRQLRYYSGEP